MCAAVLPVCLHVHALDGQVMPVQSLSAQCLEPTGVPVRNMLVQNAIQYHTWIQYHTCIIRNLDQRTSHLKSHLLIRKFGVSNPDAIEGKGWCGS